MIKYLIMICLMLFVSTNITMAMPQIMTTEQIKPGMQGYAETIIQGNQKIEFNVELIGVVNNGKGSEKQILARAYGPIIDETHGVIHGMSGSPVYVDGKLVGAVARAVGQDVLPYRFYITPIEAMLELWKLPDPLAEVNKSNIKMMKVPSAKDYEQHQQEYDKKVDEEVAKYKSKYLVTPEGKEQIVGKAQKRLEEILSGKDETVEETNKVDEEQATKIIEEIENNKETTKDNLNEQVAVTDFMLKSLQKQNEENSNFAVNNIPIYVSGFSDNSLAFLANNLRYKNITPYMSGEIVSSPTMDGISDIEPNASLQPGDPVGVVMAYGDFSAGGTGTVTAVENDKIIGFGHPMSYKGNVNYFMTKADVVGSAGGILNGMKVSTFGKIIGRINQDRFSGVAGILNKYPSAIPVRVNVVDENLGRDRTYVAKIAYDEDILPTLAPSIVYASMDRTADRASYGTAKVKFKIRTDEMPNGEFERENMFYDPKDLGQFSVGELTQALMFLCTNMDRPSNILDIKVDVNFSANRKTASIVSAIPEKEEAKPGETVIFKVMLKPYRKENITIDVPYTIPKTQKEGQMFLEVKGGGFIQLAQILQSGLVVTPQDIAQLSTADRLNELKNLNKNNEIIVTPVLDIQNDAQQSKAIEEAIKLSEEISKMSKKERAEFNKSRESKVTTDYVIDNFIQTSINIKK